MVYFCAAGNIIWSVNKIIAAELSLTEKAPPMPTRAQSRFPSLAAAQDFTAGAWEAGLRGKVPDRDTEYWKLGINVNRSLDIVREIWFSASIDVPSNLFVEAPTINRMAARLYDGSATHPRPIVRMRDGDERVPLFLYPGFAGMLIDFTDFVQKLDYPGAIYAIPLFGMDGISPASNTVEEEAVRSIELIRGIQPHGPYRIIGYSSGGCTALEAGRTLRAAGEKVGFLAMLDTGLTDHHWPLSVWLKYMIPELLIAAKKRLFRPASVPIGEPPARARPAILPPRRGTRYEFRFRNPDSLSYPYYNPYWRGDVTPREGSIRQDSMWLYGPYEPQPYDGDVAFFLARGVNPFCCSPALYMGRYLRSVEWVQVPGNHISMMLGRYAAALTAEVAKRLNPTLPG